MFETDLESSTARTTVQDSAAMSGENSASSVTTALYLHSSMAAHVASVHFLFVIQPPYSSPHSVDVRGVMPLSYS